MDLLIRAASRADIGALDALYAGSYRKMLAADYPPSVLVTALPLITTAQPALIASGTYFVAEAATTGELIGAGGWTSRQAGLGDVRHVVTDARYVRRGVASGLFARIFETAQGAGITRMACNATRTAVPFYQAMGFAVLGPIEVELRPGILFPAVQMARDV